MAVADDADDGPLVRVNNAITTLEEALNEGLQRRALFAPNEFARVYTDCYDLCNRGLENQQSLYARHGEVMEVYLTQTVLPALHRFVEGGEIEEQPSMFLKELQRRWKNHQIMNKWLKKIFAYLDKCFLNNHHASQAAPQNNGHLPLLKVGLERFKTLIYKDCEPSMTKALLSLIDKERRGAVDCDRSLAKSIVGLYEHMESYRVDLEPALLESTQQYCKMRRQEWLFSRGTPEYLGIVEDAIVSEQLRASELSPRSETNLLRVVDYELLGQAQSRLMDNENSGCLMLLQNDKWEEMGSMYRMLWRLEAYINVDPQYADNEYQTTTTTSHNNNHNNQERRSKRDLYKNNLAGDTSKGLQPLAAMYKSHILKMGMDIVENRKARLRTSSQDGGEDKKAAVNKKEKNEDPEFVKALIALHEKYIGVNRDTFAGHSYFERSLGEAFDTIVNTASGQFCNAELFATFADRVLKGNEKLNQSEMEHMATKIVQLFSYLSDKDIFAENYRVQMARRLLSSNTAANDMEAEKSFISKLKAQCGTQFTSKMEGMLGDLDLGMEQRGKFKSTLAKEAKLQLDFQVQLLTTGHWPSYKSPQNLAVTKDMQFGMNAFKGWYDQQHQKRKITWIFTQGTAIVAATFGGRNYDLTVSTVQAVVLNAFSGGKTYNLAKLKTLLNLADEDDVLLRGILHSLCCGKNKVIAKSPPKGKPSNPKKIMNDDMFTANTKFKSQLRRIRIPVPSIASLQSASAASRAKVEEERKVVIEAAIVRIMKARKTFGHQDLLSEVLKQLHFFGAPNPRVIKKRIEDLIDREYLERSKDAPNTYNYLA